MKNRKELTRILEAKNYDELGDDLELERQMFPQGYETIDQMVEDQGIFNMTSFLIEDFPERYEI